MVHHLFKKKALPSKFASLFSVITIFISAFAFVGWITESTFLTALWPGGIPMAPSTSLLFLVFGLSLMIWRHNSGLMRRISPFLAWIGTLIAIILAILSSLNIYLKVEYLGMNISGAVGGVPIGHMSPLTAICFIIVGASLLLHYYDGKKVLLVAFWTAASVLLISLILIIGYIVGAPLLYGTRMIPPAMTTSLGFMILSISLLFSTGIQIWSYDSTRDDSSSRSNAILVLVFLLVVIGILSTGYLYSKNLKKHFHKQAEAELTAIAELKIKDLVQWRKERMHDASLFFRNTAFSDLVSGYFANPNDLGKRDRLVTWLQNFQENSSYDEIFLSDPHGTQRISIPQKKGNKKIEENYLQILHSHEVTFLDFHTDPPEKKVHLDIAIPILAGREWKNEIGMLIFRIDPGKYLYPLISRWPVPRNTSESLIVRREGDDVLFLNNLRFMKDAAFSLRVPLTKTTLPAAMAVLGINGIVQGLDYRGIPVLAAIKAVPGSPWLMVAKIDLNEVNHPLYERLIWMTFLLGALLLGAGSTFAFVWRNQRSHFYRKAVRVTEESEKRLMIIFESAKDGIMVAETETKKVIVANKAISQMLGYSHEELMNMEVKAFHPPEKLPEILEGFKRQACGDISIAANVPMQRKNGSIFYADINTTPIEYGGKSCLLGTFRDITDRMQTEARIEHLNRVLHAIRNVNQLIVRAEIADELIQKACDLLVENASYSSAVIILTGPEGKTVMHAEAGGGEKLILLQKDIENGALPACCKAADTVEGVCIIEDREDVCNACTIVESCISPQKMSIRLQYQDKMYGYLAVTLDLDIAMDREEEDLFAELASDLAYSLHNIEVKSLMQKAEDEARKLEGQLVQAQKMEAVGQLAGGIAHDFNNLLTIILGYSQMMEEGNGSVTEASREIHSAANRAKNLTRQLLAFSRKQILAMRVVDVNEIISNFENLLRRTIGEDIRMGIELTTKPVLVKADISQLEQILMNLAINARDAMPNGGSLMIETDRIDLDENYVASKLGAIPGPHVMISVSDNGTGMNEETLKRIFEPFYTTKGLGRGTGLGLSTVYGIVKQHGGNIWVYSEPGQGTRFKIYLPCVDELEEEKNIEKEIHQPTLIDKVVVMVVEDEGSLRKLACSILKRAGYLVYESGDTDEAIDIARESAEPIRLLLTDVVMPKMKGTEVFEKVSEYHPQIRVLYMSGYTENVIARHGILKEGIHFLQKPFSAKLLLDKISEVLRS